ncbi:sulfotransferase [Candidatus Latescibacterota bacterium]
MPAELPIVPFITIVSGLPRSGTSMVMHMLKAGGMDILTDHIRVPDDNNPRGYFEFERVKDLARDASWMPEARGRAVKIISQLLYHLPADEHYKIIFIHRRMGEILSSQRKMLERLGPGVSGADDSILAEKFERHLAHLSNWLEKQKHIESLKVQYEDIIADPHRAAERIRTFLGVPLDSAAMTAVVDPSLYRNRHP